MNNTILKRLKISQAENPAKWKWDLRSFLLMYNSTPHSTTGEAPSALMFGRILRDKIPSILNSNRPWVEDIRDRDWERKVSTAESADHDRNALPNQLEEGDIVVAKRITKENKLSTNYNKERFKIVNRHGSEAEIRSLDTGKIYRRNVTHLKKIHEPTSESNTTPIGSPTSTMTIEKEQSISEDPAEAPMNTRRSTRPSKRPEHLRNYVQALVD